MQSLLRGLSRGASRGADLASTSVSQAGRQRIHKVGHRGRTGGLCPCSTAGSSWPHPFTVTAAKGKPQTALPWLYFPSSLSLNEEIKLLHTLFKKHILISPEKRRYRVFYPPHGEYTSTWHLPNVSFSDWHTVWWAISPPYTPLLINSRSSTISFLTAHYKVILPFSSKVFFSHFTAQEGHFLL